MPEFQKPADDSPISDDEELEGGAHMEEDSDEDIFYSNSDNESSSDSSLGKF